MNNSKTGSDFFLSYTNSDKAKVLALDRALKSKGAKVALDVYEILGGDNWQNEIFNLLENSKICVAIISKNSRSAKVQPSEIFHFQYLQSKNPDFYRLIPLFLDDTTTVPGITGLDTLSSFYEKDGGMEKVADKLMETLQKTGDSAERALRSMSVIDELARIWLNGGNRFGARFRLDGDSLMLSDGGYIFHRISRDEFENKLSDTEKYQIEHIEKKLEALLKKWKETDLDIEDEDAEVKADQFASRLGESVKDLLDLLVNAGFALDDHYEHIRNIVASYERRKKG